MAGGNAIRGSRIGAGPMGEAERGEVAPRRRVSFWCANGHESRPSFAADAQIPDEWECPRCGYPTNRDKDNPPAPPKVEPYKTHLAYVRERRDDQDGEAILNEALDPPRKDSWLRLCRRNSARLTRRPSQSTGLGGGDAG